MTLHSGDLLAGVRFLGARPAYTWDVDGAYLELSGNVAANHAHKISNFLSLDCGFTPGETLALDVTIGWRSTVWILGAALAGLTVISTDDDAVADAVALVTADASADHDELILVDPGILALGWPGELPDGAWDGIAEVMQCADSLLTPPHPHVEWPDDVVTPLCTNVSVKELTHLVRAWADGTPIVVSTRGTSC